MTHHLVTQHPASPRDPGRTRDQRGMSTAEYAVGTVSACGFGSILYQLLTSDFGQNLLQNILEKVIGLLPF